MTKKDIILKGKALFMGFCRTQKDTKQKYRITLELSNYNEVIEDIKNTFKDCPLKPEIVTNADCKIVNIKSLYDFPCKVVDESFDNYSDYEDISDFISTGYTTDAEVIIKVTCKNENNMGALYPKAIKVVKVGSKYDAFDGM